MTIAQRSEGSREGVVLAGASAEDQVGRSAATKWGRSRHAYGLEFTPNGDGTQMHGLATHVIDKSGHLRARFQGLEFKDVNLVFYVKALTNGDH
jgi:hypothetical protein